MNKKNIIGGTPELITKALGPLTNCAEEFSTITFARKVASFTGDLKLPGLVNDLWKRIEENWKEAGRQPGGAENWRWKPQRYMHPDNPSEETRLEKGLARVLPEKRWANQIPTSSGLISSTSDKKRNIDLAHWDGAKTITLVELKVATNTPVYAAFEIVRNALLLCLARAHQNTPKPILIAEEKERVWTRITKAHLRVVAPKQFYRQLDEPTLGKHYSLGRFEEQLGDAVSSFGSHHGLQMSFGFRVFDLTDVLLNAIETAHAYAP